MKVPEYTPNVSLRPALQQDLAPVATAEAFGAGIGRGMQSVARGAAEVGEAFRQVQALTDEALVKDARIAWSAAADRAWADPESGYAHTQGALALDGRRAYEQKLAKAKRELTAKMTPEQRARFEREIAAQEQDAVSRGMIHEGNERKRFVIDSALASADNYQNEAVSYAGNPQKRDEYLTRGIEELRDLGAKLGWSDEKLRLEVREYTSKGHVRIAGQLAQNDPIGALEYLTEKQGQMLPEDAASALGDIGKIAAPAIADDGYKHRDAGKPAPGSAADLIREFEGFRETPYWDVNAHRVGYGSDTITRADGTIVRVTTGTKVSRADAERDLARRINDEFVPGIVKMVGRDKWNGLPEPAKAALTSVAYNYGSLPNRVAQAVVMGDLENIAVAVESLKTHNGGVNAKRRAREAAIIRGAEGMPSRGTVAGGGTSEVSPGSGPRFSARVESLIERLPVGLATQLREVAQQRISRMEAEEAAAMKAERAERVDSYRLRIAEGDLSLTSTEILSNPAIDDGDKATLLNSYNEKYDDLRATQQNVTAFQAGAFRVDPYTTEGRKAVDGLWDFYTSQGNAEQASVVLPQLVEQTGVIPQRVFNGIRGAVSGTDIRAMVGGLNLAVTLSDVSPAAFGKREGGGEIHDAVALYRHYVGDLGMTQEQAAAAIIDSHDPEKRKARAALVESKPAKDWFDQQVTASNVGALFAADDGRWFTYAPLGDNPVQEAAMLSEYRETLELSLYETAGNFDAAKTIADDRFKRRYGVTEFSITGESTITRLPIEKTYSPAADGGFGYIRDQAKEMLKAEGITADDVYFIADDLTERDVDAGKPPRYRVFYTDESGVLEEFNKPMSFTAPTPADKTQESRRRMQANRERTARGRDREGNLDRYLDGDPLTGEMQLPEITVEAPSVP